MRFFARVTRAGSSPLTRGKRVRPHQRGCARGLIPAHAGKTSSLTDRQTPRPAHPRSRGENRAAAEQAVRAVGSSPLTRGKHGNTMPLGALIGLIPAHAGKTLRQRRPRPRQRAHPRSRGENPSWIWCLPRRRGSSPLTRGKHGPAERTPAPEGLIPAHAGKTGTYGARLPHPTAHPRSRGENPLRLRSSAAAAGSSPLTRGKQPGSVDATDAVRLIPAHAGKTGCELTGTDGDEAHPRSRGENSR